MSQKLTFPTLRPNRESDGAMPCGRIGPNGKRVIGWSRPDSTEPWWIMNGDSKLGYFEADLITQGTASPSVASVARFRSRALDGERLIVPGLNLAVYLCDSGLYTEATSATIAVANGSTLRRSLSATKALIVGPANSAAASLTTAQGSHKDIVLTAVTEGSAGNDITYTYQAGAASGALACAVTGTDIVVTGKMTAGTAQVESATIAAPSGATSDGILPVTLTGAALPGDHTRTVNVTLTTADNTATAVATAIRVALAADSVIPTYYTCTVSGADITITAVTKAANDATLALSFTDSYVPGVTLATSAGLYQRETAIVVADNATTQIETATVTAASGATEAGILTVQFISALNGTVNVPVTLALTDDSATKVATAIAAALEAAITTHWDFAGDGADVVATAKVVAANDTTAKISWGAYVAGVSATADSTNTPPSVGTSTGGNLEVVVTVAGVAAAAQTVAIAGGDTPTVAAGKIAAGVTATGFAFTSSGASVLMTSSSYAATDATLNVAWAGAAGIAAVTTSTNTTLGARTQNLTAGVAPALDSTASEIIAKIAATATAAALVTATLASGQNGTGKPAAVTETALTNGGTGAGDEFIVAVTDATTGGWTLRSGPSPIGKALANADAYEDSLDGVHA